MIPLVALNAATAKKLYPRIVIPLRAFYLSVDR